jgi:RNA polymerase-binding transcription factor DksA
MTGLGKRLEVELQEAEEELQELDRRLNNRPEFGPGAGSAGAQSWEMALARKERVIVQVGALREALTKVHEGTYGRCEECGAQIDPERLEILPATTLCAACARSGVTKADN